MTPARAALVRVLCRYSERTLEASLVEVQKLLYFLQVAGEPLRPHYVKAHFVAGLVESVLKGGRHMEALIDPGGGEEADRIERPG